MPPRRSVPMPAARTSTTILTARRREADEFYASIIPASLDADARNVMRQALAGMLWSKQFYNYDVDRWLSERGADPFKPRQRAPRNDSWHHMENSDIISMPDKWEYPWYAAWDLAFHVLALTLVDEQFGKQQLDLMLRERYLHPNGQIPAYEWNFGDVNPPGARVVDDLHLPHGESAARARGMSSGSNARFHKLLLNFTWWVNRRTAPARTSSKGASSASTTSACSTAVRHCRPVAISNRRTAPPGWRSSARTCSRSPAQLALEKPAYADMCVKFLEHYLWIASSMVHAGEDVGMWDEEDGFFYDVLRLPGRRRPAPQGPLDGRPPAALRRHGVRRGGAEAVPGAGRRMRRFLDTRPELTAFIIDPGQAGSGRPAAGVDPRRNEAAPRAGAGCSMNGSSSAVRHPLDLAPSPGAPVRLPRRRSRNTACRTFLPSPTAGCSAAIPTGGGRSGCR